MSQCGADVTGRTHFDGACNLTVRAMTTHFHLLPRFKLTVEPLLLVC